MDMYFVGVMVGSSSQAIVSDDNKLSALLFYLDEIKLKTED